MVPVSFVSPSTRCRQRGRPAGRDLFRFGGERYFFSIGGPIFSAGAGGNAAFAPCRSASGAGRAGSGAGLVGRVPPGFDSAGLLSFCATAPCGGALEASVFCCAPCAAAIEAPDATITIATISRTGPKSIPPLRLCRSRCMVFDRVMITFAGTSAKMIAKTTSFGPSARVRPAGLLERFRQSARRA